MANILIVDDDRSHAKLVADWLKFEKHSVNVLNSGVEGWTHLRSTEYDLVVLDWDMPDLDGIDILRQLRDSGNDTPIIMLTGRSTVDDKVLGFDAGATDYITKPFHMKELSVRIKAALKNQAAAPRLKALGSGNEELLQQADLAGTALAAKYEFLELLGEGGIARVFKARHPHLDKLVAVKMLQSAELSQDAMARFEREARVVSKLEHPNIITVYDFGLTERQQPYMVMEFINGRGLDQILQEQDYLELKQALSIMLPVCDGIAYAHEHKILHRDLKPGNIMLKKQIVNHPEIPKVLDFGLAKHMDQSVEKALNLTQTQQIIGTPPYMSPEVVRQQTLDERSDVYSFACVIFETVTGYPPFVGDSAIEIILKHIEEPPLSFDEARPGVAYPPELEQLISRALEIDPGKRYQNMRELQAELANVLSNLGSK